jgi:leucyl aminopeptidase (aminopeptidase T)
MDHVEYDLLPAARRVIDGALALVPGDNVVIVSDRERAPLATALAEAAAWSKVRSVKFDLDEFGPAPLDRLPKPIETALNGAQASVFVARGHSAEIDLRRELVTVAQSAGLRHAHMLGLNQKTMVRGLAVDPHRIADVARALRSRLRPSSEVRVRSRTGTDLRVKLDARYRWFENSGIIRAGRWLNLPAGELSTSPAEIDGTYVCDASMTMLTGLETESVGSAPLSFHIVQGRVVDVTGANSATTNAALAFTKSAMNHARVGLFSFGTNIGLSEPGGTLIVDQTLPGVHICLGAPVPELTGLEWGSTGQLVLTGTSPDVDIDGEPVMRVGRYLVG